MMPNDIIVQCTTFLLGVFTGAGAMYFGNKYTDQRRAAEARREDYARFKQVESQMPELIEEMRVDLCSPDSRFTRVFFICHSGDALNNGEPCFIYHEDYHENLRGKVHVLENCGYVTDVTLSNVPKYRISEAFVYLISRQEQGPRCRLAKLLSISRRRRSVSG